VTVDREKRKGPEGNMSEHSVLHHKFHISLRLPLYGSRISAVN